MKHIVTSLLIILFSTILNARTFSTADPPMIYIYHFVSYDSTTIINTQKTDKEDKGLLSFKLPFTKPKDIKIADGQIITKPIDPKLISTMVTTTVGKFPQIKIAGESIQSRIRTDDFMQVIKSYNYPDQTDFIIIGEINTLSLAGQYEIDLKIIDVSKQEIISSESFQLGFTEERQLRQMIESRITTLMEKLLKPFTGFIYVTVDSSSYNKVRWDYMALRPLETMVSGKTIKTTDKDFEIQYIADGRSIIETSHSELIKKHANEYGRNLPIGIIMSHFGSPSMFLEGEYQFRAYLRNNLDPFEKSIYVKPGDMNKILVELPPEPKPEPVPPPIGSIVLRNIQEGIGFELIDDSTNKELIKGEKIDKKLRILGFIEKNGQHTRQLELPEFVRNAKLEIKESKTSILIENVYLGKYYLNYYSLAKESFPGKQYIIKFNEKDSLEVIKRGDVKEVELKDIPKKEDIIGKGKEIVIYFHPYPSVDETYKLYDEDGNIFSTIRNTGEVHVLGIELDFAGMYTVLRPGYEAAFIVINKDEKKIYALADLSIPGTTVESPIQDVIARKSLMPSALQPILRPSTAIQSTPATLPSSTLQQITQLEAGSSSEEQADVPKPQAERSNTLWYILVFVGLLLLL